MSSRDYKPFDLETSIGVFSQVQLPFDFNQEDINKARRNFDNICIGEVLKNKQTGDKGILKDYIHDSETPYHLWTNTGTEKCNQYSNIEIFSNSLIIFDSFSVLELKIFHVKN